MEELDPEFQYKRCVDGNENCGLLHDTMSLHWGAYKDLVDELEEEMQQSDELMPEWLNMVKGVVDSEDLPLSISHETLQRNKMLRVIRKNFVKKCLEMFAGIAEERDDYKKFYEQFGKCLKWGVHEDSASGTEIAELLRWHTLKSSDEQVNFKEYVDRMKEGQQDICCISGESSAADSSPPFLETLQKRGLEDPQAKKVQKQATEERFIVTAADLAAVKLESATT